MSSKLFLWSVFDQVLNNSRIKISDLLFIDFFLINFSFFHETFSDTQNPEISGFSTVHVHKYTKPIKIKQRHYNIK